MIQKLFASLFVLTISHVHTADNNKTNGPTREEKIQFLLKYQPSSPYLQELLKESDFNIDKTTGEKFITALTKRQENMANPHTPFSPSIYRSFPIIF